MSEPFFEHTVTKFPASICFSNLVKLIKCIELGENGLALSMSGLMWATLLNFFEKCNEEQKIESILVRTMWKFQVSNFVHLGIETSQIFWYTL